MAKKITHQQAQAFIADLRAVIERHQLMFEHYHIEYDEWDSDEGYEIVPLSTSMDLHNIVSAHVPKKFRAMED